MTDLTPNHPAVEALARELAQLDDGEPWPSNDELGGHHILGTRDDEYRFAMLEEARAVLNAVLPHLTADDLPARLVRDIQVRAIRAAARAATYDEGGIPGDHYWNLATVSAWLDGLADNIEEEADHV